MPINYGSSSGNPFYDFWGITTQGDRQRIGYEQQQANRSRDMGEARDVEKNRQALMTDFAAYVQQQQQSGVPQDFRKLTIGYINTPNGARLLSQRGVGAEAVADLQKVFKDPNEGKLVQPGNTMLGGTGPDGKPTVAFQAPFAPSDPGEEIARKMASGATVSPQEFAVYQDYLKMKSLDAVVARNQAIGTAGAAQRGLIPGINPNAGAAAAPQGFNPATPAAPGAAQPPPQAPVQAPPDQSTWPQFNTPEEASQAIRSGAVPSGPDGYAYVTIAGRPKRVKVGGAPSAATVAPQQVPKDR